MFDIGTKVVTLTSSVRKSAGPRRGSLGYVIASANDGAYVSEEGMSFNINEVIFTRYGFEKNKDRREKRVFFNVFPVIEGVKADVPTMLKQTIRNLHKEKFEKDIWKRRLNDWGLKPNTPIGILVPVCDNKTDLRTCKNSEFIAWLDSHLMTPGFRNILIETLKNNKTNVPGGWVNMLTEIAHEKNKKDEMIPKLVSDIGNRMETIKYIRSILAIGFGNNLRLENVHFSSIVGRATYKGSIKYNEVYRAFIDGLYSPAKCKPRQAALRNLKLSKVNALIDNLERTKQLLGASSFPLLRSGKGGEV
jgi:hypothetical protein